MKIELARRSGESAVALENAVVGRRRATWAGSDFVFARMKAGAIVVRRVKRSQAIDEAERAGFDLSMVDESLKLTHEERARQHDQALALVLELDQLRRDRGHAKPESTSAVSLHKVAGASCSRSGPYDDACHGIDLRIGIEAQG